MPLVSVSFKKEPSCLMKFTAFQSLRLPSKSIFFLLTIDTNFNHTKATNAKVVNLANVNLNHIPSLNQYWLQIMFHPMLCVVVFEAETPWLKYEPCNLEKTQFFKVSL